MKWLAAILLCLCPLAAQGDVAAVLFRCSPLQYNSEYPRVQGLAFKLADHISGKKKLSKAARMKAMEKLLPNRNEIRSLAFNGQKETIREMLKKRLGEHIRTAKRYRAYDERDVADLIVKEYL